MTSFFSLTSQQFHTLACIVAHSDFMAMMALGCVVDSRRLTGLATMA
jgi:hypothetical protein